MKCTSLAFRDRGNSFVLGIILAWSQEHIAQFLFISVGFGFLSKCRQLFEKGLFPIEKKVTVFSAHSFNAQFQNLSRQCLACFPGSRAGTDLR